MSEAFDKARRRACGILAYHMHEHWERGLGTQRDGARLTPDHEITDEMAREALYRDLAGLPEDFDD